MTLPDIIRELVVANNTQLHKPLADNHNKTVYYPVGIGSQWRHRLGVSGDKIDTRSIIKAGFVIYLFSIAVLMPTLAGSGAAVRELIGTSVLAVGWLLCCAAAILGGDDVIHMNRLTCIIPTRNPLVTRKLLWSKLEEISIVDSVRDQGAAASLGPADQQSSFALRLLETSGAEHFLPLKFFAKEDLASLVEYIRQYAPHTRGIAQLGEVDRFFDYQNGNSARISYTQLWESACTANFQLTSFTPLCPGALVQGEYKVVKQIAAGGFSAIYLIEGQDGLQYVLKESVLPPGMDESAKVKAIEHFQREARILAKLDHVQIARVHDHFVEAGRSYLRMEYIEGESLRTHIRRNGAATELQVVTWLSQLSKIIAYLHGMAPPVVHRDLTPDNILLRPDGSIVLIDFGAANEFIGSATGTLIGKHAYMAPEQIQGCAEPVSDIYSLGAVAYYCMCSRDPEPIRTASPLRDGANVTGRFDEFVRNCTNLDKGERLQSGEACLHNLREIRGLQDNKV